MSGPINLVLLTGFLGAGKTTLLNQVLDAAASTERRVGVLMNEFGKVGVDGALVHRTNELSVFEVSDGSIFCTCKSASFVTGLRMFARMPDGKRPDRLIVEASGMSDPSGLAKLLRENRLAGDYTVVKVVCLVDSVRFRKVAGTLPAVTRQIEAADLVVLNKADITEPVELDETEQMVRSLNAKARIVRSSFGKLPDEALWEGSSADLAGELVSCTVPENRPASLHLTVGAASPTGGAVPGAPRSALERFLRSALDLTYRLKGWLPVDGSWFFISDNSGRVEWSEQEPPRGAVPGLAVICPPENADRVAELWRSEVEAACQNRD
jgi:G3E family GTPase